MSHNIPEQLCTSWGNNSYEEEFKLKTQDHAQLYTHDEFFVENGQVLYKKRGGFAVLKTMLYRLRSENPGNTLLIDGGDCFQGGGLAALSQGKAIVPLINNYRLRLDAGLPPLLE